MTRKAVFLDRDGVLNESPLIDGRPYAPATLDDFQLIDGVTKAIKDLKQAQYKLIVVTNQPDVARGTQTKDAVDQMNAKLHKLLPELDEILVCFHIDEDGCSCRKPKPGFLLQSAKKYNLDLSQSYIVGDRWRDVEAGQAAGCKTVFIDYDYNEKQPQGPDAVVDSLLEASEFILSST